MEVYIKIKRDRLGTCNLCKKNGPLTWDHVPPRGSQNFTNIEIENVFEKMRHGDKYRKYKLSQNGLKFRTLCKACNEKIGHLFDPVINDFTNRISTYVKSKLHLPNKCYVKTNPNKLIRGLLAHLISAKIDIDKAIFDEKIRNYVFDLDKSIPDGIYIYFWIYPYYYIEVVRDFGMTAIPGDLKSVIYCNVIKYFPIAFLITESAYHCDLEELTKFRNHSIHDEKDIEVYLNKVKNPDWPNTTENNTILFFGQSAIDSLSAKPRRRGKSV